MIRNFANPGWNDMTFHNIHKCIITFYHMAEIFTFPCISDPNGGILNTSLVFCVSVIPLNVHKWAILQRIFLKLIYVNVWHVYIIEYPFFSTMTETCKDMGQPTMSIFVLIHMDGACIHMVYYFFVIHLDVVQYHFEW